ncbi:Arrestin (or S-antigen), C-terminal domain [Rhizoctonia solani]|uniref:Arrestin (Or S-antigen), C-terminal domain n=1 Tax=Rhizoctonia solani TaxID=456999 RepID=A0A8H7LNB0_9AGAM|nr:Arrestin (or S-antigen), C-terminal domain [Rhizoctonia solani]
MVTPQSQLGLGLGLPNSGSLYNHSRDPQIYKHSSSGSMDGSHPVFSHSQMMSVAATVVGSLPNEQLPDGPSRPGQGRSGSDDTVRTLPDMDPRKYSAAHLKLTRCRVRSEPTSTVVVDRIDSESSPAIPRVDSLLHLGSEVASKDLNKLLNARVRQAPLSIDIDKANGPSTSSTADSPTKDGPRSSRLETEKSRPRVELYFDLNNQVAVEGGLISGSLTVRTRKPRRGEARHVRIDGGKIRVLGYEGVSESERYAFYQCTASLVDAAGNLSQLYESSADSEGFHIAREGTFTTAFKMHIPQPSDSQSKKSAPKGVIQDGSISATIKYILLVSFKVRDDSDNATGLDKYASLVNLKTSIAHFYRHVEIWPSYGPLTLHSAEEIHSAVDHSGTVSSRTAQELFLGGSGMLHLTAVLHRKIWLAGQKCTVYIGVWNETRKFVKALNLAIIRKTSLTRPNQNETTGRKQIAEVTLDAFRGPSFGAVTGKGWWAGIEPGSSSELSYMISIPIDALTVPRTHIIEISYVLRVSLITGSLSSNVSVDLPLVIINALSTDGIPTPPPPGLLTGSLKLPKDAPVLFSFKTPRTKDNANIDLRTWSYPHASPRETSPFPRDYILDWTKRTSAHPPCETDPSPIRSDYTHGSISLPVSARASPRIGDTSTTSESVSNLITQLESDLDSIGQTVSADQERRSVRFAHQNDKRDPSASDTLKARSSTKHRVTFMMPIQLDADMGSVFPPSSEYSPQVSSGTGHYTGLRQQPLVKKLNPQDREPISVNPDKDIWTSDDADAILNSIRPDTQTFCTSSLSSLSHTQEIVADRPSSGLYTASTSTSTSEPWSSSGTTTDCHSGTDHYYSRFDAPGPGFRNPPARYDLQDISSAPGSQSSDRQRAESLLTEDTPRAGSVRRFQPELIAGAIQMSASRATLVSAASSPMLAKSQSAYVIGSPVNQYRRFVPQNFAVPPREGTSVTPPGKTQLSSKEKRKLNAEHTPWKTHWDKSVASIRHSPRQLDNDLRTSRIHLRAHSTPQPRENQDMGIAPSQSTVRSRIAALEERSRGRPSSSYS